MKNLSQLLTAHAFPTGLDRIRRSFARQPDCQTCGASAIRHGLLLGGLTLPTATLEAMLDIRGHEGTPPPLLRACIRRLGLEARLIKKPARQSTETFLDRLRPEFDRGAFLVPCVRTAAHWVCIGAWQDGRVGLVDSFFARRRNLPALKTRPGLPDPALGFFHLSPRELDVLDWAHYVTLVRPGIWEAQFQAWLPVRSALLRLPVPRQADGSPVTVVGAIRHGVHQYLDDQDYSYGRLRLSLRESGQVSIQSDDPGGDAVGMETIGEGSREVLVVRRLGGLLHGRKPAPELVVRASALRAGQLDA